MDSKTLEELDFVFVKEELWTYEITKVIYRPKSWTQNNLGHDIELYSHGKFRTELLIDSELNKAIIKRNEK